MRFALTLYVKFFLYFFMKYLLFSFIGISYLLSQSKPNNTCQYDGLLLQKSYEYKYEDFKKAFKWKCLRGHTYWIVENTAVGLNGVAGYEQPLRKEINNLIDLLIEEE